MRALRFQTLANGEPIENFALDRPAIAIQETGFFEELEARAALNLSQAEYDALPGVPDWIAENGPSISKAHVIAFYRMKARIEGVSVAAERRKAGLNAK